MDDLISKTKALLDFQELCNGVACVDCPFITEHSCAFADWLNDRPSAEPRWIPVAERLPEVENNIGKRVIVTTSWGLVKESCYCIDHWEIGYIPYKLSSVIAWMPLPKPWKGEDDG